MPEYIAFSLLILLINISIAATTESSICGQLPHYNLPTLTHSKPTHHWPWHAAIFHRRHIDLRPSYECGGSGTVINRNWILTAAHCVSPTGVPMEPMQISVLLGRVNLTADETRTEQSFNATEIVVHEKYHPTYQENDIALIQLSQAAKFNDFVRPICLWQSTKTELSHVNGKFGTVVGWGITEAYETASVLQEASFPVVSHIQCLVTNREFFGTFLSETNYCAGLLNDSGGSMTFEEDGVYYIRGIASSSPATRLNNWIVMRRSTQSTPTLHSTYIGSNPTQVARSYSDVLGMSTVFAIWMTHCQVSVLYLGYHLCLECVDRVYEAAWTLYC